MSKENNTMKKFFFIFIVYVICGGISVYGDIDAQEEVGFLLFAPNSGSRFEDQEKAFIQLNNLAQYLLGKTLVSGQIIVYGYAAHAPNDIKSVDLSRERALTVMEELQKRGVPKELFSEPVGYGEAYQWGNNDTEDTKKFNRRARVLLGEAPMPLPQEIISTKVEDIIPELVYTAPTVSGFTRHYTPKKASFKFPWWILFLLVLLALCFFLFLLLGRRSRKTAAAAYMVNLDDEIRARAFELSRQRCGHGDYQEQDWYNAVREISTWYIACGHSVFSEGGRWWASCKNNN
jgi:hypothetical protein